MGPWTTGCWRYIPDCTEGMTLALWLKVTTLPGVDNSDHGIISTLHSNKGNGFFLCIFTYSGNLYVGYGIYDPFQGSYEIFYYNPVSIESWGHYVFDITYNSGSPTFNFYMDGSTTTGTVDSYDAGFTPSDTPRDVLVFGNMYADNPDSHMPSVMIDEVLMFNYTLNSDEVAILYGTI